MGMGGGYLLGTVFRKLEDVREVSTCIMYIVHVHVRLQWSLGLKMCPY